MMRHPDEGVMRHAIEIAKERKAVTSVIVRDGEPIAEATSSLYEDQVPFRHAEINAIEEACKQLGSFDLSGCWLYTTYEPCPMCASACVWARLEGIVYGASMEDRNEAYTQRILIRCRDVLTHGTPRVKLHEGFMRDECTPLLLL